MSSSSEYYNSGSENDEFQHTDMSVQQLRELFISLEDHEAEAKRRLEEVRTNKRNRIKEIRYHISAIEILLKLNAGLEQVLKDMSSKVEKEVDKKDLPLENDSSSVDTV